MTTIRIAMLALIVLLCPAIVSAGPAKGRRAECRRLCVDALSRCADVDGPLRQCRKQVRAECRRNGPDSACAPSYSGSWTLTPTSGPTDTCGLAAGADPAALTRMVVTEHTGSDIVSAEFGPGRDAIVGYLRDDRSTILEGATILGGCEMVAEVYILPSTSLPRFVADARIRSQGVCGGQSCLYDVEGRWAWQPD